MASKRKQEEKHLKMLREMVAQEPNKKCFDCGQRGPTYVNMTIGSFVCTTCSGILRGLNPPHRVKSISMASYTPQEMLFLQQKGNEYCRQVWLGLWDARSQAEPESRDEQKVKDFMSQKYERKRWYIAPEQAAILASQKDQQQLQQQQNSAPEPKPLKTLIGRDPPQLQVQNHSPSPPQTKSAAPLPSPPQHHQQQPVVQPAKASVDLLGDLGGDPFGQPAPQQQQQSSNFGAFGTAQPPQQQQQQSNFGAFGTAQPPQQQQSNFDPFGSGQQGGGGFADFSSAFDHSAKPAAASPQSGFTGANLLQPNQPGQPATSQQNNFGPMVSAAGPTQHTKPGDRYAALSQLDSLFHDAGSSINWSGGPAASSASSNTSVFSSSSSYGTQPVSMPQSSSLGNIGTATSWSGGGIMSASASMGSTPPSNPFMAPPTSAGQGMAGSGGFGQTANPFLTQSSGQGFGQSNGPYGQTGQGQAQANMGFGAQPATGFGVPQQSSGFGQQGGFGQQAGGFGQGGFGQQGGFGTQQAGGFGQQGGFGTQQAGGFGTQQAGGFGTQQAGGFGSQQAGGFGTQQAGQGGFGAMQGFGQQQQQQHPQQQGLSFGGAGMTAMAGQQFAKQQQQQQPQQQFGSWGQPMQQQQQQQMNMGSNPFMSAGQNQFAAKSATGNPFL